MADIRVTPVVKSPLRMTADASQGVYIPTRGTRTGDMFTVDWLNNLAMQGRIFVASGGGAAVNTASTGAAQTSFSATAPDFTLEAPSGVTAIPLRVLLKQAGTVAGGAITVIMAVQNAAERSSAGTVFQSILSSRTDAPYTRACTPYIAPTVSSDTVGPAVYRDILTQSVTTGRTGGMTDVDFQPFALGMPLYLVGPAALKVYSFAGTTAPSWFPTIVWAEIPSTDLT